MSKSDLFTRYKKFVNHKAQIIRYSKSGYKSLAVLKSLDKCKMYISVFKDRNDDSIASLILRNQHHLKNILPHPNNDSYKSSLIDLNHLLTISNELIHNEKEINANS